MHLSVNAFVARFRSKEYFEEHGYSKGLEVLEGLPGIADQYIIVDSHHLHDWFTLRSDGKSITIEDYMVDMKTKITVAEAQVTMSMLFI